jgi:hypothetical protein
VLIRLTDHANLIEWQGSPPLLEYNGQLYGPFDPVPAEIERPARSTENNAKFPCLAEDFVAGWIANTYTHNPGDCPEIAKRFTKAHAQEIPTGNNEAQKNWYYVHMGEKRHVSEVDMVFRDMLRHERRTRDSRAECKVYCTPTGYSGHGYYFSPDAAERYSVFVILWNGSACFKPADLRLLTLVA